MTNPEIISNNILNDAIKRGTTDIHFTPNDKNVGVYFRINGYRWFYKGLSFDKYQLLLSYYKFISGMDIAEKRIPQNGTLSYEHVNQKYDLRLSTLPTKTNESIAIRILSKDHFPSLNQLFLFPKQAKVLMGWMEKPAGIILFTGPTGSGKTTTMYALLKEATKKHGFQAITLEDPIEQTIHNLLQVQVNEKTGFDYHVGLKAALRHDPDIIMIGEIRDEDTAKFAFRAAFTGHLVLSTVHAKNAYGTIFRLKEMGINKTDMHESIIGICSQQLIVLNSTLQQQFRGRAAICELLTGPYLTRAINGFPPEQSKDFLTFDKLRRKANALGFIS